MSEPVDLALGILDHQLVDSEGRRCGKVDDLEVDLAADPPRVTEILVGRRSPVTHVSWDEVATIDAAVHLRREARELRLGRGDDRARKWLDWIPERLR